MAEDDNVLGDLEDQVTCWICFETFNEPTTLGCNHTFCHDCVVDVMNKKPTCPFCRQPFAPPLPPMNQEIQALVARFKGGGAAAEEPVQQRVDQDSPWFWLPKDVKLYILKRFDAHDVARWSLVSHDWSTVLSSTWLWRDYARARWPFCAVDRYGGDWKKCYAVQARTQLGWDHGNPKDFTMTPMRGHKSYVTAMSMYRSNVVSGSNDNSVMIWNVNARKPLHTLSGHTEAIHAVAFNELRIVSASQDGSCRIWDTAAGEEIRSLVHGSPVKCASFAGDIAFTGAENGDVSMWDLRTGQRSQRMQSHPSVQQLERAGPHLLVKRSDTASHVWDMRQPDNVLHSLPGATCMHAATQDLVVFAQNNGAIERVNPTTGVSTNLMAAPPGAVGIAAGVYTCIRTDGQSVVVGDQRGSIVDVSIADGTVLGRVAAHTARVNAVLFDEGKIVSAGGDNTIKVTNKGTHEPMYTLLGGSLQARARNPPHPDFPGCSFLSYNESRVVGAFNSLLRVWSFTV